MAEVLVALGVMVPLVVALTWAIWWLVASARRERRRRQAAEVYGSRYQVEGGFMGAHEAPAHLLRGQGEAVTVAELLEEAIERGEATRLNWPEGDLDQAGWVRPYAQDQFPTAILPRVEDTANNIDVDQHRSVAQQEYTDPDMPDGIHRRRCVQTGATSSERQRRGVETRGIFSGGGGGT
jgi:hypothetical protein